jgi:hypothetical protein
MPQIVPNRSRKLSRSLIMPFSKYLIFDMFGQYSSQRIAWSLGPPRRSGQAHESGFGWECGGLGSGHGFTSCGLKGVL